MQIVQFPDRALSERRVISFDFLTLPMEKQGEFEEALEHLKQVDPQGSLAGGLMMVPRIQKKLEEKQAGKESTTKKEKPKKG